MKLKATRLLCYFGLLFLLANCEQQVARPASSAESGAGQAMDFMHWLRAYPDGRIPNRNYIEAFEAKKQSRFLRSGEDDLAQWEAMGPWNIGGRATFVAFDPVDPELIYLGTASGGLWVSETAGKGRAAWQQMALGYPVAGIGSIAVDPKDGNVIYLGTGESYNFDISEPGVVTRITRGIPGIGILKSIDKGATWQQVLDWSYKDQTGVQDLLINPQNSNTVFAATKEGLLRSTDAGQTWQNVNRIRMAVDIEMDPLDTNIVYITHGNYQSSQQGIYRSTNGGNTFRRIQNGLPSGFNGKAMLSISPTDPEILYLSLADAFESIGLYRSNNRGDSWTFVNDEDVAKWQGWYSHDVAVDPSNPDHITYVGIDVHNSWDGGDELIESTSYNERGRGQVPIGGPEGGATYVHSDIHQAVYHPLNSEAIFLATDGGLFVSEDNGESWEGRNGGLQTQQFYANFSSSLLDSNLAIGGMQDNSSALYIGDKAWVKILGGDGMSTAIDPLDDRFVYGSSQYLNMSRSNDRGANFQNIRPSYEWPAERPIFAAPFELAPSNPRIIYAGTRMLHRSDNRGTSWEVPSGNFLHQENAVHTIAVAPNNPDLVYLSTVPPNLIYSSGRVNLMKTTDGGKTFKTLIRLPDRPIPDIAFHPQNENVLYAVLAGFGTDHVYKTEDAGETWESISNGLPDVPFHTIFIDPENPSFLYVGGDAGVYYSNNDGENWEPFISGLPEAAIAFHFSYSASNRRLRLATHGNGVYESPLIENSDLGIVDGDIIALLEQTKIYPNPTSGLFTIDFSTNASI
ncbi:MAG: hypothetical protein AAF242_09860, partial [Bacteroidota bacterium]